MIIIRHITALKALGFLVLYCGYRALTYADVYALTGLREELFYF